MTDARRTVTIRFEVGAEPITGTVAADGEEIGFAGWIEFASLIDRVRSGALPIGDPGTPLSSRIDRFSERPEALPGN